jgi:PTS system cellobiose-specific IIC component
LLQVSLLLVWAEVSTTNLTNNKLEIVATGRYLNIANLGAQSLFGAIVTALISVEIYRFMKVKILRLKCQICATRSCQFIYRIIFSGCCFNFWVIRHMLGFDINATLSNLLMPLQGFAGIAYLEDL